MEELFCQAITLNTFTHNNEDQLKRVLYEGLRPDIKHQAAYKNDMITDYNLFKMELRKIEAEMKESERETKKCSAAMNIEKKENSELSEVKQLLTKLNERMDKLEKNSGEKKPYQQQQQQRPQYDQRTSYGQQRPQYDQRTSYGQQRPQYDQRTSYGQERPSYVPGTTYRGRGQDSGYRGAYRGSTRGRGQDRANRPTTFGPICYNCQNRGHIAKDCPNA